jgi:hypothetical protein
MLHVLLFIILFDVNFHCNVNNTCTTHKNFCLGDCKSPWSKSRSSMRVAQFTNNTEPIIVRIQSISMTKSYLLASMHILSHKFIIFSLSKWHSFFEVLEFFWNLLVISDRIFSNGLLMRNDTSINWLFCFV